MRLSLRQGIAIAAVAATALPVSICAQEHANPSAISETQSNEKAVADAYVYLLGRAVVIRQEQEDLKEKGIEYNVVKYNPVGKPLGWVNPNLDVTNTEAWIAVDDATPALLELPRIEGRYYTVQICDEWGEVITNINPRNYPDHPFGTYAFLAPGSKAAIPDGAVRIELRSPKAKMLARIEIKGDAGTAVALQRQTKIRSLGKPKIRPATALPPFDNAKLIGVELFDYAEEILNSAPDVAPIASQLQVKVRDVTRSIADPGRRAAVDAILRNKVIPAFQKYSVAESGATRNNWVGTTVIGNYGDDFAIRTAANYVGIWANARHEVIYFVTTRDGEGKPLDGGRNYVIHFPKDALPDHVVNAYWSLSLVDAPGFLAVPNPIDRYTFNSIAPPKAEPDGSLKIFLAPRPGPGIPESNWLPAPDGKAFSLTFRTYVPKDIVKQGAWFPPAISALDP